MVEAFEIRVGDARKLLPAIPDESVQCVVSSPPYFGLRDYGTGSWAGGDPACKHRKSELRRGVNLRESAASTRGGANKIAEVGWISHAGTCPCGAVRADDQLGLEATGELYVTRMVALFAEVRRTLRKDGTLWLNMGDSYTASHGPGGSPGDKTTLAGTSKRRTPDDRRRTAFGLPEKSLIGMPWRLALALQADGWILRRDIIWAKPNPMPESVRDRPTTAHEYLFLFSKSGRYHYDAGQIMEPVTGGAHPRGHGLNPKAARGPAGWDRSAGAHHGMAGRYPQPNAPDKIKSPYGQGFTRRAGRLSREFVDRDAEHATRRKTTDAGERYGHTAGWRTREKQNPSFSAAITRLVMARNKRSVWTIATQPFRGAHFATFPEALVEPCILAGSRPGQLVLDPFAGSATVGVVALRYGRRFLGLELNEEYARMGRERVLGPLFTEVSK